VGATLLAGPLAGCTGTSPPGQTGDLGNGVFSYVCDSGSDPVCDDADVGALLGMPAQVAVGARFSLQYTPSPFGDDSGGSSTVEPASDALLTQTEAFGKSFKGIRPGLCAILARRGETVLDFVHVRIEPTDHVRVDRVNSNGDVPLAGIDELDLELGQDAALRAYGTNEADTPLGGAQAASWSSSDEAVVDFDTLTDDNEVTVRAMGVGTATLTVEIGDQVAEIPVTVGGEG
jgi:hypothetical protein